jgi:L-amino acid N-acyltransferase YncA
LIRGNGVGFRERLVAVDPSIRTVEQRDWEAVTEIFNHFVANSLAAYPEEPVAVDFFRSRHLAAPDYPFLVAESLGEIVGFAYLSPFHPVATMRRSATLTYFIHPDYTAQGLGGRFLDQLLDAGRRLGVTSFLAHISSANEGSIRFHARRGFTECGRFLKIGDKHGRTFDMVWMQRIET